jgi:endonuclease-3
MLLILGLMEEHYGDSEEGQKGVSDPFRTLIATILSQRTRDQNSGRATRNLLKDINGPGDVLRLPRDELSNRIRCSGFYNQKARNIIAICETLEERFGGEVPDERSLLMSLPGVGPKTADIVLSHAFGRPAIAVDTHVLTVAKRLGLVGGEARPSEVKETLEGLVDPELYGYVDRAFVTHGKEYCRSRNPRCTECFLIGICIRD